MAVSTHYAHNFLYVNMLYLTVWYVFWFIWNFFVAGARTLRVLLSFAVGGLLGDVFLHLLPEAWGNPYSTTVGKQIFQYIC